MVKTPPTKKDIPTPLKWLLAFCLFIAIQLGLTLGIHQAFLNNTPGMDFHIYWVAGRAIQQDISPYGEEVALESQVGVLRRPALPNEDQMGFAYPIYALLPVFPTLTMTFDWAQAAWLSFNLILFVVTLLATFRQTFPIALSLSLTFFPMSFALILGNMNIPVTLILILSIGLLFIQQQRGRLMQILLGVLLAWATIKPQFSIFFLALIGLYALHQKMRPLIASFLTSLFVFLAISTLIWPRWPVEWLQRMTHYTGYINSNPILLNLARSALPASSANIITLFLAGLALVVTVFITLRWWRGRYPLGRLLAWIGLISYLSMPISVSYEQIRFYIPLLFWLALPQPRKAAWWIFGPLLIILSWLATLLPRFTNPNLDLDELRLLCYLAWMLWYFWLHQKSSPRAIDRQELMTLVET